MEHIGEIVKKVMLMVQRKAHQSGHLNEDEQVCFRCGAVCMGEDDGDHPAYNFYCECGNAWCDTEMWANRKADWADNERKRAKENL